MDFIFKLLLNKRSSQRIDYVRQNIEKFAKKNAIAITKTKSEKTPIRNGGFNLVKKQINDENKPLNSNTKVNSLVKNHQIAKNNLEQDKKEIKTNLISKINANKNVLANKNQLLTNDKQQQQQKTRLSNDKPQLQQQKSTSSSNDNKPLKVISVLNNDKQQQQSNQIKQSVFEKPTKTLVINLNEDLTKNRLVIEHELLKLKYLILKCETKLRKQNQSVIEIVKHIFNLIRLKQANCLQLEQELALKETLLFLLKLSEESLQLLKDIDLGRLEAYLNLVFNLINSALSSVKIIDLKNAKNINGKLDISLSIAS